MSPVFEIDPSLELTITTIKPTLDLTLDPMCVVDVHNRIIVANLHMKSFLGLMVKDMRKFPVFCDRIKIGACEKECQVVAAVKKGKRLELDEVPAVRGKEKLRIWLRASPLFPIGHTPERNMGALGMLIVVRNTTAELVLQAKYHKLVEMISERERQIGDLEYRLSALQGSIRKARERHSQ